MLRTDSERAGQEAVVIIQVGKDKGGQSGSGRGGGGTRIHSGLRANRIGWADRLDPRDSRAALSVLVLRTGWNRH